MISVDSETESFVSTGLIQLHHHGWRHFGVLIPGKRGKFNQDFGFLAFVCGPTIQPGTAVAAKAAVSFPGMWHDGIAGLICTVAISEGIGHQDSFLGWSTSS